MLGQYSDKCKCTRGSQQQQQQPLRSSLRSGSSNSLVGLNTNHSHSQTNNLTFSLADYVKSFFVFRSRPGGEPQIPSDLNTLQRSTCCRKHRPGRNFRPGEDLPLEDLRLEIRTARSLPPGGNPIIESYHHSLPTRALVQIARVAV